MDFNIYCDESCHLEHDGKPVMLLGAVRCPTEEVRAASQALRAIKQRHMATGELKWLKVSRSRNRFYQELTEYFFSNPALSFRCLVVDDKSRLDHEAYNKGSHDSFYYKMYYYLLRPLLSRENNYEVYLDIKDTRSQGKIDTLKDVLTRSAHDYENVMIRRIQHVRSHEVELLQLADFLLGAVSYQARSLSSSAAKTAVVQQVCLAAGHELRSSTPPWEEKFNLFYFTPRDGGCQ
ncbi:MAG: DUF3800 domain-containing protein [Actinomycetota bacterium]|nr:DUF3800 domain-containing protein [Actinomycetota bacterium]MDP3630836.1 DUF3800 domain-containing protein [Actinomycetota bacterium]